MIPCPHISFHWAFKCPNSPPGRRNGRNDVSLQDLFEALCVSKHPQLPSPATLFWQLPSSWEQVFACYAQGNLNSCSVRGGSIDQLTLISLTLVFLRQSSNLNPNCYIHNHPSVNTWSPAISPKKSLNNNLLSTIYLRASKPFTSNLLAVLQVYHS